MEDIERLIQKGGFWRAERRLRGLVKRNAMTARAYYLWGCIYEDYRNPKRSPEKAREYFELAIEGDDPSEDAFLRLASLETSAVSRTRVLRRGIEKCPKSRALYTELLEWSQDEDSEAVFKEMLERKTASMEAARIMAGKYFTMGKFSDARDLLASVKRAGRKPEPIDVLLSGYSFIGCDDFTNALKEFESLANSDITHKLGYAPLFGLVICHLEEGNRDLALAAFEDIPDVGDFSPPYDDRLCLCIYDAYVEQVIRATTGLLKVEKDKRVVAKARGVRGLVGSVYGQMPKSRVIADLRAADKQYPANIRYCNELRAISIRQGKWRDAYTYTWRYLCNSGSGGPSHDYCDVDLSFVFNASEEDFLYMVDDIKDRVENAPPYWLPYREIGALLDVVIQRLAEEKKHRPLSTLADVLPQKLIDSVRSTFHIAYAYDALGSLKEAESYYRICEARNPREPAVTNNLGWISEQHGDYVAAKQYYLRAHELNPDDELYKGNLGRLLEYERAASAFREESHETKKCLLCLWKRKDLDGVVHGAIRTLAAEGGLSRKNAREMVTHLTAGNLLVPARKQPKENESVHRVNPYLSTLLTEFEVEFEHSEAILGVATEITPEALMAIGYTSEVIGALKKISSSDLQSILGRDLREAALSLLTKCFKTTLVLSGSAIEAILLDRILTRNFKTYVMENGRRKNIDRMGLDDFLYVARSEKIIDDHTYHLAHALRGFRNLIHPGVQQRKAAISVSENDARIAWDILRKLIVEL